MPRASSPYADLHTLRRVRRVLPLQICTASGGSCLRSQRATALPRQLATVAPGGAQLQASRTQKQETFAHHGLRAGRMARPGSLASVMHAGSAV